MEKAMELKLEEGMKVRATSKITEDFAEFIVVQATGIAVYSEDSIFSRVKYNFEVLEKPAAKLPVTPGLYGFGSMGTRYLLLTNEGVWYWVDFTYKRNQTGREEQGAEVALSIVQDYAGKLVCVYEYGTEFYGR